MVNVAYIYQPHFKTSMFRVAVNRQQGDDTNYIVVTCSPQYNGLWKYDGKLHKTCGKWVNGKTVCYEIPIAECTFVKGLNEIQQPSHIQAVVKQQEEWFNNKVRNREYTYAEKPPWMLK